MSRILPNASTTGGNLREAADVFDKRMADDVSVEDVCHIYYHTQTHTYIHTYTHTHTYTYTHTHTHLINVLDLVINIYSYNDFMHTSEFFNHENIVCHKKPMSTMLYIVNRSEVMETMNY
jgi:hypothetical protein